MRSRRRRSIAALRAPACARRRSTTGLAPAEAASRAWRSITVRPASGRVARKWPGLARFMIGRDQRRQRHVISLRSAADGKRRGGLQSGLAQAWAKSSIAAAILRSTTGSPGAPSSASSASAIRPTAPKLAAMLLRRAAAISQLASQRERPSRSSWRAALSMKAHLQLRHQLADRCRRRRRARRSKLRDQRPSTADKTNGVNEPFHIRPILVQRGDMMRGGHERAERRDAAAERRDRVDRSRRRGTRGRPPTTSASTRSRPSPSRGARAASSSPAC